MKIKNVVSSLVAISSIVLLSTQVQAEEPEQTEETEQKEQTVENAFEDCGIGAAIFQSNKTAATISNVIWDFGTTAVSSQTSSPSSCAGAQTTAAIFIDKTYPVLEEQFVKGGGSHVAALMDILECDPASHQAVISDVQSGLATSFSNASFPTETQRSKSIKMGALLDKATASCNA